MKMKKIAAVALAIATLGTMAAFASCGGNDANGTATIEFAGSTSVQPLMGALADEYMKTHDVEIKIEGGGSSVGVANAKEGKGDFGMSSAPVSEDGVTAVKICDDGIVVIANTSSELTNVTSAQLYDFYTAGTAIGSATLPVTREPGSGTRGAFEDLVAGSDGTLLKKNTTRAGNTKEFNSTGGLITEVQTNKAALGYISLGSYVDTVKKLTFEGVEATVANIKAGSYTLSRPFVLAYNTEKGLTDAAQAFLDWILSTEGQAIVESNGYIKL